MKRAIIITLIAVLLFSDAALAGESVTLGVSCTIPAIPGVNAPPFPNEGKVINTSIAAEKQEENTQKTPAKEAADNQPHEVIVQEETDGRLMQTVYNR